MYSASVKIVGTTPYSASRYLGEEDLQRQDKEDWTEYEKRVWLERCHFDRQGNVCIPGMAFKFAIMGAASYIGEKKKGNKTMVQSFTVGLHVQEQNIPIGINRKDIAVSPINNPYAIVINAHSTGDRFKEGKRVPRIYPIFPKWACSFTVHVLDDAITKERFHNHLRQAGLFLGMGRFAPRRGGTNGRFDVSDIKYSDLL